MATRSTRERQARQRAQVATRRRNARPDGELVVDEEPHRGRRWLIAVGGLAALLGIAVVAALVTGGSSGVSQPRSTLLSATPVEGATGALALDAVPTEYTITYELVTTDGANNVADTAPAPETRTYSTSTESFRVRRPFATHIEDRDGAPPGGDLQATIISDLGLHATVSAGDEDQQVEAVLPGAGIGDWRLDAVLGDLVDDGTFVLGERRELLGRECQVYRTGSPLENYELTKPTDTTYADVCVDAAGLVLEQVAVEDGALLEHLTATDVDTAPSLTDADFAITGTPPGLDDGGMVLTPIDGVPTDSSYWSFSQAPPGYILQGRFTWQQNATDPSSQGIGTDTSTGAATAVVTSYVDVYTNGADVLVVLQGPTSVEPDSNTDPTIDATAPSLGEVTLQSKLTGTQLLAHPTQTPDWFVQVTATTGRNALVEATALLQPPTSS
ncbi:MAG: hypothetical protein QM733_06110 [Ilumatobacteraceae bacterium]